MLKIISNIFFIALWIMALVVILGFVGKESRLQECNGLQIKSDNPCRFVEIADVHEELCKMLFSGVPQDETIQDVDLKEIEIEVLTNPYIKKAEAFTTINGSVNLKIEERIAYLRFTNQLGDQFIVDRSGIKMPVKIGSVPHLPIASGFISESNKPYGFRINTVEAAIILKLQMAIERDEVLKSLVTQIYYNSKQEIELISRIANHTILIGDISELDKKFDRIKSFYKGNIRNAKINKYKTVDVRFKKQVICR